MKYRRNTFAPGKVYFYYLEPGDSTFYEFALTKVPETATQFFLDAKTNIEAELPKSIDAPRLSGWTHDTWIVTFYIGGEAKGVGFVGEWEIKNWETVGYAARGLATQLDDCEHTGIVLLAALSVLIADPSDVSGACQRMMLARERFQQRGRPT